LRRFDRCREVGAVARAVGGHHGSEPEAAAPVFLQREADEAARVLGHEVDRLGRDEVRRDDEIAFVLAILLVDEDHHAPGLELGDDLREWWRAACVAPREGARF
jgi:hypothetical protein